MTTPFETGKGKNNLEKFSEIVTEETKRKRDTHLAIKNLYQEDANTNAPENDQKRSRKTSSLYQEQLFEGTQKGLDKIIHDKSYSTVNIKREPIQENYSSVSPSIGSYDMVQIKQELPDNSLFVQNTETPSIVDTEIGVCGEASVDLSKKTKGDLKTYFENRLLSLLKEQKIQIHDLDRQKLLKHESSTQEIEEKYGVRVAMAYFAADGFRKERQSEKTPHQDPSELFELRYDYQVISLRRERGFNMEIKVKDDTISFKNRCAYYELNFLLDQGKVEVPYWDRERDAAATDGPGEPLYTSYLLQQAWAVVKQEAQQHQISLPTWQSVWREVIFKNVRNKETLILFNLLKSFGQSLSDYSPCERNIPNSSWASSSSQEIPFPDRRLDRRLAWNALLASPFSGVMLHFLESNEAEIGPTEIETIKIIMHTHSTTNRCVEISREDTDKWKLKFPKSTPQQFDLSFSLRPFSAVSINIVDATSTREAYDINNQISSETTPAPINLPEARGERSNSLENPLERLDEGIRLTSSDLANQADRLKIAEAYLRQDLANADKDFFDKGWIVFNENSKVFPRRMTLRTWKENPEYLSCREYEQSESFKEFKEFIRFHTGEELKIRVIQEINEKLENHSPDSSERQVLVGLKSYLETGKAPRKFPFNNIELRWYELIQKLENIGVARRIEYKGTDREKSEIWITTEVYSLANDIINSNEDRKVPGTQLYDIFKGTGNRTSAAEKNGQGEEIARWYSVYDEKIQDNNISIWLDYCPHGGNCAKSKFVIWGDMKNKILYVGDHRQSDLSLEITGREALLRRIKNGGKGILQKDIDQFKPYM